MTDPVVPAPSSAAPTNPAAPPPGRAGAHCALCGRARPRAEFLPLEIIRPSVQRLILADHPGLPPEALVCAEDLSRYRSLYVEHVLEAEKGELDSLEEEVLKSLHEHELLSSNVNEEYEEALTLGERVADRMARFGGSWRFILTFAAVLVGWIGLNAAQLLAKPFDPYPFILLNLVLSCLAALQAPVIMMSQNRQEAKDRLRSENDYRVNLKAELEIRHLNEKMDHLVMRQWQRLLEIQELQMQVLQEIAQAHGGRAHAGPHHPDGARSVPDQGCPDGGGPDGPAAAERPSGGPPGGGGA
jgi:uncharacterized membrane protein